MMTLPLCPLGLVLWLQVLVTRRRPLSSTPRQLQAVLLARAVQHLPRPLELQAVPLWFPPLPLVTPSPRLLPAEVAISAPQPHWLHRSPLLPLLTPRRR